MPYHGSEIIPNRLDNQVDIKWPQNSMVLTLLQYPYKAHMDISQYSSLLVHKIMSAYNIGALSTMTGLLGELVLQVKFMHRETQYNNYINYKKATSVIWDSF